MELLIFLGLTKFVCVQLTLLPFLSDLLCIMELTFCKKLMFQFLLNLLDQNYNFGIPFWFPLELMIFSLVLLFRKEGGKEKVSTYLLWQNSYIHGYGCISYLFPVSCFHLPLFNGWWLLMGKQTSLVAVCNSWLLLSFTGFCGAKMLLLRFQGIIHALMCL